MANTITVNILADVKNMVSGIGDVNNRLNGMQTTAGKVGGMLKTAFGAAAIAGGLGAVGNALGGAVEAARESAKVGALTEQTIKSMGNAAGISAKQVGDLSGSLAMKTGVDDEVIQSGANLVLTFGNIKNAAGEGNDMFNQTVEMANNMSVALGQDMSSSAMQLGKALNDPIAGVGALSRVGVQFTEQQKEQIKTMVESGDILGAQGVILGEVGKQFGGAAEAAANPVDKLKVVMGNLQEEIGTALLPVIDKVATYIGKNLPSWIETGKKAIEELKKTWESIKPTVEVVWDILKSVGGWMISNKGTVLAFAAAFTAVNLAMKFDNALKAAGSIGDLVKNIKVVQVATKAWTLVQAAFNLVMMVNPFVLIVVAIAAFVALIIWAWNNVDWFKEGITKAWEWIKDITEKVWNGIKDFFTGIWDGIKSIAETAWNGIKDFFTGLWDGVKAIFQGFIDFLVNLFLNFTPLGLIIQHWETIKNVTAEVWEFIKGILQAVWDWIVNTATSVWNGIKDFFTTVWNGIKSVAETVWNAIKDFFTGLFNSIKEIATTVWNAIKDFLGGIWDGIKSVASTIWNAIKDAIGNVIDGIKTVIQNVLNTIKGIWEGVWNSVKDFVSNIWEGIKTGVTNAIGAVGDILGTIKDKVLGIFSAAGEWLLDAGKWVVEGLWDGISGAAEWIWDKITGWVGGLVDGVLDFLGINSPSRVFADIGDYMVAGLAKGIQANKDAAKAADSLAKNVVNAFGKPELAIVGVKTPEFDTKAFSTSSRGRGATEGGERPVVVNFNGIVGDPNATAKAIERVQKTYRRSGGRVA